MKFLVGKSIKVLCLSLLVLSSVFMGLGSGESITVNAAGNTYYVSPGGDDTNAGTESFPWRTLKKAALTLQAGDTAIFEDGEYNSTEVITFANSGTEGNPITIKAKNKHQAKLTFTGLPLTKILLEDIQNITIQDFEITQSTKGPTTHDVYINLVDCDDCTVIGNVMHNSNGKAITGTGGENIVIRDNTLSFFSHSSIYLLNADKPIISGNEIHDVANGLLVVGGTRSAQIYNNYLHASISPMSWGIVIGGNSPAALAYDPTGYEAYHSFAWNNIIVAKSPGLIDSALVFGGSTDSGFFHNVVVNTNQGVRYYDGGWGSVTTNSQIKNNIFYGCQNNGQILTNPPLNLDSDYNLYYNCVNAPVEDHSIYEDPLLFNPLSNWNIKEDSPAIGAGTTLNAIGFYDEPINVSLDYSGQPRSGPVHLGIYANALSELGDVLFEEDFEGDDSAWSIQTGDLTIVEEGSGNHAFTQLGANSASGVAREFVSVDGAMEWESYVYEARVKFDDFYDMDGWLTLYARYLDINHYYLVEIKGNPLLGGYIALKRNLEGQVIPLQEKINWLPPTEEWMDIRIKVNGPEIEVYINDVLELSGTNHELTKGSIGAAIYRSKIFIDDIKVTEINDPLSGEDPNNPPTGEPGSTYYVSPTGSDNNPGTESEPWQTMAKAAQTVMRGDTVIFEDGVYAETRPTVFARSGTEDERIVFKARNKHQAIIRFDNMPTMKIWISGKSYITIQDFEITQNARGVTTSDFFVSILDGANHVHIKGNKIHHAFEEGIKATRVNNLLVEGNIVYDMTHEAIDLVNVHSSSIRNNEVYDIGRVGIMIKGGSHDVQIHNNLLYSSNHALSYRMVLGAITIGGVTDHINTADPSVNGHEAYNLVAYNNVIWSQNIGGVASIDRGISFLGSKDSAAYNNIVSGTTNAFYLEASNNTAPDVGWDWDPDNVNTKIMNNIIVNSLGAAIRLAGPKAPVNMTLDYNLYHNNASQPASPELNGVYADPKFVNAGAGDWHLAEDSPAISAGMVIAGFSLKDETTIDISADFNGDLRGAIWDLGIFRHAQVSPSVSISGPAILHPGQSFTLAIALQDIEDEFVTSELLLQYDSSVLEFDLIASGTVEGYYLAEHAATSLRNGFTIALAGIKPTIGEILLMGTSLDGLEGNGPLLALNGRVKSDAPVQASTEAASVMAFVLANADRTAAADVSRSAWSVQLTEQPSLDTSHLAAAIVTAQQRYSSAIVGTTIGHYRADAKGALQTAISHAESARNSATSQSEINTALSALDTALQSFNTSIITLAGNGATKVTIQDLAILIENYGKTAAEWDQFELIDVFEEETEVGIRILAYVAKLIVDDWLSQ